MNKEQIKIIVSAMADKKAVDIRVLQIEDLTVVADYFIICAGTSVTQIKTIADAVEFKLEQAGTYVSHREGYSSGNWILLDYGTVIVHIFHPTARE